MKKLNSFLLVLTLIAGLFSLTACSKLEITEEMQKAMDIYIDAVSKTASKTKGNIKVTSVLDDSAIEFKTTKSVIECDFEVVDEKVLYTRTDYTDDKESAKYKCDGTIVEKYDYESGIWVDKTEENSQFLSAESNPLITLSLFRVDSELKINTDYLTAVESKQEDGYTVVEFTLDDDTVSDVLSYNKAQGIVRQSAGHIRSYYIDKDGYISKVVVTTVQNIISNGEVGIYKTSMVVECE